MPEKAIDVVVIQLLAWATTDQRQGNRFAPSE
jgi:hypothetical protein